MPKVVGVLVMPGVVARPVQRILVMVEMEKVRVMVVQV